MRKLSPMEKNDQGYLAKIMVSYQLDDALELWQEKIARLKQHILIKRVQFAEIQKLKENLTEIHCLSTSTTMKITNVNNRTRYKVLTSGANLSLCSLLVATTDQQMEKLRRFQSL